MPLPGGTRLGPYDIVALIGAGGMGEVYRAHDTKLNRDVAIKVLPESFAADPDRIARFKHEAQVLASLNHPHIAAIYGFEDSGATHALVLELVEGATLADRISSVGRDFSRASMPLDEVLPIARQIAEALEAAHERGIIHRDLKPANIKLTADGSVKVLDFGLAKAFEPDAPDGSVRLQADLSLSPTMTSPAMTRMGMILGTAAYMSPEQAKGKLVDKRTDIWAFACVLYEMLTGKRAFGGEDVTDTLAEVIKGEPDWTALPADTPPQVRKLLRRCLEKDRKRRLADISDARYEIDDAIASPAGGEGVARAPTVLVAPRWRRVLPWAVATVAFIATGATLLLWAPWRPLPAAALLRVSAELGVDASLVIAFGGAAPSGAAAVVSPDGSLLAFVARPHRGGAPRLYIRRLDQLNATELPGTEGAAGPFFSPNGKWLGFFGGGKLKKIAVAGGASMTLANASSARGGSWAEDGTIIYTPTTGNVGLSRVPEAAVDGTPELLTTPAAGEATHRWPQVLPGGRAVLYTVSIGTGNYTNSWLAVQPLPTGAPHSVQRLASYGRYLPSGHLTWIHEGTLFAAPFDLTTLAVTGPFVQVVPGVMNSTNSGGAQVEVSNTGTLVYLPGGDISTAAPLYWLTRDGGTTLLRATPASWSGVRIAPDPDGGRLAFTALEAGNQDVWTYDVARDLPRKLTTDPGVDRDPVWTPDGHRLVYASSRKGVQNLWWQRADGGVATPLTTSPNQQFPGSWDPSGHILAFHENRPQTGNDLLMLRVDGDEASGWTPKTPKVFLDGPSIEQYPRFSPDGQWLAYESDESGAGLEIYVQLVSGAGGKSQISNGGGTNAVWSLTRQELLYQAPDGRIMVVPYRVVGGAFRPGKPGLWSDTPVQIRPLPGDNFDLHPDGKRVVMAPVTQATASPTHVTLIFNFFDELRRLAPVK